MPAYKTINQIAFTSVEDRWEWAEAMADMWINDNTYDWSEDGHHEDYTLPRKYLVNAIAEEYIAQSNAFMKAYGQWIDYDHIDQISIDDSPFRK